MRPYFQRGLRMNYEKGYYSNGNVQYDAAKEFYPDPYKPTLIT